jgi:anti-sigma B factor antagonist
VGLAGAAAGHPPGSMRFETDLRDGVAHLALFGELDMGATFSAEGELDRLIERENVRRLVIDLRGVTFLDSTGLRLLVQTDARAREGGFELALVRGRPDVQRVFQLAGLGDVLPFTDA